MTFLLISNLKYALYIVIRNIDCGPYYRIVDVLTHQCECIVSMCYVKYCCRGGGAVVQCLSAR
jgi:hypothetical protein